MENFYMVHATINDQLQKEEHEEELKYENLSESNKIIINSAKVNFQGIDVSFPEVIGDDQNLFNFLDQNQLNILINLKIINIGELPIPSVSQFNLVERTFIPVTDDPYTSKPKSYSQIINDTKEKRVFILADSVGAGKTIAFEHMTCELKQKYPNYWVSHIRMSRHEHIIASQYSMEDYLTTKIVLDILVDMLHIPTDFERQVFLKMFMDGHIILLFDDVDQISIRLRTFVTKFFYELVNSTHNKTFIATGYEQGRQLSALLMVGMYEMVPLEWSDKLKIIEGVQQRSGNAKQNQAINTDEPTSSNHYSTIFVQNSTQKNQKFIEDLEKISDVIKSIEYFSQALDTPFMMEVVTAIAMDENYKSYFWSTAFNLYSLLEIFIIKRTIDLSEFKNVHQFNAVTLLLADYIEDIKDLSMIKQWQLDEKNKSTAKEVERFGILTVNSHTQKLEFKNSIYAEFFLTDFLISNIFQNQSSLQNGDVKIIFTILKMILMNVNDFEMTRTLLLSYISNDVNSSQEFYCQLKNYLLENVFHVLTEVLFMVAQTGSLKILENWSLFLIPDPVTLKLLWLVGKNQNILKRILCQEGELKRINMKHMFKILLTSLGENWHIVLDKSKEIMEDHESLGDITTDDDASCKQLNKNLRKLLLLVEHNYTSQEMMLVYKFYIASPKIVPLIHGEVLTIILAKISSFDADDVLKVLMKIMRCTPSLEMLTYLGKNIESQLKGNIRTIRKVLFQSMNGVNHPLVLSMKLNDLITYRMYRDLYIKYKITWCELKKILTCNDDLIPELFLNISQDIYTELVIFMAQIFTRSESMLISILVKYCQRNNLNVDKTFGRLMLAVSQNDVEVLLNCIEDVKAKKSSDPRRSRSNTGNFPS